MSLFWLSGSAFAWLLICCACREQYDMQIGMLMSLTRRPQP